MQKSLSIRQGITAYWLRTGAESIANHRSRLFQFQSYQFQTWWTHTWVAHPYFDLYQLDELHEMRHRIHAQQRQEPPIKIKGLVTVAVHAAIQQINRLAR